MQRVVEEEARRGDGGGRAAELQPVGPVPVERREEDARGIPRGEGPGLPEREDRAGGRSSGRVLSRARRRGREARRGERRREGAADQRSVPGGVGRGALSASPTNGTNLTGRTLFSV